MGMYDLNINATLLNYNFKDYKAVCINIDSDINNYTDSYDIEVKDNMYTKICIRLKEENISRFYIKTIPYYDIISILVKDNNSMEVATGWDIDVITIDIGVDTNIKRGLIKNCIHKGIFIEIPLRGGLYDRDNWLRNVNRILGITKGKNTIITSGAKEKHELKHLRDIKEFLKIFNFKEERIKEITEENPKKLLKNAALKRFSANGVVNNLDEGNLKRNFILNEYKYLL
ncbi:RNase P subunit p30 [Spraguea lophii 42_110]|uniref:RNase P subunit p30 n=1 Tax=Spraguea lophii (strain 42_110) TaxID=1358809 RepID=S7XLU2_SPRLO|nr:RNase P subunit p30 [Spraguea lophii 42_110]